MSTSQSRLENFAVEHFSDQRYVDRRQHLREVLRKAEESTVPYPEDRFRKHGEWDGIMIDPPKLFDMRSWCQVWECGTSGCALGHAATDPEFRQAGLVIKSYGIRFEPQNDEEKAHMHATFFDFIEYLDNPFDAARLFFALTCDQAEQIFLPVHLSRWTWKHSQDLRPSDVIKRMDFLKL